MRGLYVHIPFCARKCSYCDFYSLPASRDVHEAYFQAVLHEARSYTGMAFQTLYIGGGTPSLPGGELISGLIKGVRELLDLSGLQEASIEVNPDSALPEFFTAVREAGITRVSIGVQSLDDGELRAVGRIHDAGQAVQALALAKRSGFDSVSADIMVGLPGQTEDSLRRTVEGLADSGVEHLSMYCLSLEHDTPLAENPPDSLPDDDEQVELFLMAASLLKERGFSQYEISNFARPGFECRHNLIYWHGGEYLGLGPAAASHLNGKRFRNKADLEAYLKEPAGQTEDVEKLNGPEKAAEEAVLRLRLLEEGLDTEALAEKYGRETVSGLIGRCEGLVKKGWLVKDGQVDRLAPDMVMVSNTVFAEIIEDISL